MSSLRGKTLFVTGASRGIGKAIALRAAADGANIALAAKTTEPHPKLEGTIYSAAAEIEAAGGKALPLAVDIRDADRVQEAVAQTAEAFGGIDILINNASAISLTGLLDTPVKRLDLMWGVNARGTFVCSQACVPYLKRAANPHILTLAPPPSLDVRWWSAHLGYSLAKFGMSFCVLGLAEELRDDGIAVNGLWPRTIIATAALAAIGAIPTASCRKPEIVADAAHAILVRESRETTGQFFVDEDVLRAEGVEDFSPYAVQPGEPLLPDLFLG
jgi:citronellol/citronellal dehydrogenase